MNYEAERAMNQKRLRMEGEPGHGVVQGNGLPLNYIDNGHQIPYQPYAGAYNAHYPPPDAFAAYGAGGYAQSLPYAPPAHQNYPHHQFPQQQMHMPQSHMAFPVQGYGEVHKGWALGALDAKPLDVKHKEIKLEPADAHKRPHHEPEMPGGDLDQPKIKIKTDIFKPDDLAHRPVIDKPLDIQQKPIDVTQKPADLQNKVSVEVPTINTVAEKPGDKPAGTHKREEVVSHLKRQPTQAAARRAHRTKKTQEASKPEGASEGTSDAQRPPESNVIPPEKSEEDRKPFSSPDLPKSGTMPGKVTPPGLEPKKRGRPKGSTNKPKPPGTLRPSAPTPRAPAPRPAAPTPPRPRPTGYQYNVRPFRKDFSGIQFRRRWSDDCLDSSHIPNEVYFGDVPVPSEVLYNYYDAHAERSRLAAAAAQLAAQKAAHAKLTAARMPNVVRSSEVTTVDSSSSDDSSGTSGSGSEDSDEETPLKRGPGRPKGTKNTPRPPGTPSTPGTPGSGKRGRPKVPPELRTPGITEMKKFCKAAGIRFDYKKLTEDCTKNKERVQKMQDLLTAAGLEGKPSLEKCQAIKKAKLDKKEQEKLAKKEAKAKHKEDDDPECSSARRMTRGATGVKPRQRIVISSDEEDDTPAARRTLSKLRSSVNDSDSD